LAIIFENALARLEIGVLPLGVPDRNSVTALFSLRFSLFQSATLPPRRLDGAGKSIELESRGKILRRHGPD
jgi:hypothetical protein